MEFFYTHTAEAHFKHLSKQTQKRIAAKMRFYAQQPDPLEFAEPLTGIAQYRFRIGDYRVRFEIIDRVAWVLSIRRRDEAYRK